MNFEIVILDFIRENLSHPFMDGIMKGITFLGNAGWFWICLGVVLSVIPKTRKIGLTVCLALVINLVVCNLTLKPLIGRMRPFDLKEGIDLLISKPTDFSFPSGHTSASFASAVAVFMYNKKYGSMALVLAFLIAFSRLYLYVHFPTDVLGGIIIGSLCGICAYFLVKLGSRKINL